MLTTVVPGFSSAVAIGLVIQALAILLMRVYLGRRWTRHIGAYFIVIAVVYHGLGEILIDLFPGEDGYRALINSQQYLNEWVIVVSLAILLFTVTYLMLIRRAKGARDGTPVDMRDVAQFYDWRLLALAALPLIVLTAQGNGYVVSGLTANANGTTSTTVGFVAQFFLIVLPLAAFSMVARFGRRWLVPALLGLCIITALVGQRLEIIAVAVCFLWAVGQYGMRLSTRAKVIILVGILAVDLLVTSARANEGRVGVSYGVGAGQRVSTILHGVSGIGSGADRQEIRQDLGYRLDGNSWGALVLQALLTGSHPAGAESIVNDLRDAVPAFLAPGKDLQEVAVLNETAYQGTKMNLPPDPATLQVIGVTPTDLGTILGYWGVPGLLILAPTLGALFALLDRWLRHRGPVHLLVGIALVESVMFYERNTQSWVEIFRGALLVALAVLFLRMLRALAVSHRRLSRRPASPSATSVTRGRSAHPEASRPSAMWSHAGNRDRFADFTIDWD